MYQNYMCINIHDPLALSIILWHENNLESHKMQRAIFVNLR